MNSQQDYKKFTLLLLMQVFKLNNKESDTNIINNTHLLTFTQVITNSAIPYFVYLNLFN